MTETSPTASTPRISVVTVVYNGAREIARTLDSTLAQDHPNLEVVVVDGQSSDGTQDIIKRYGSAIDVFVSERDRGIYDAMNKAVALASGDYLLFMNCGDRFAAPDALSSAARALVPGTEQAVFGRWERENGDRRTPCRPSLEAGIFNHQAVLYSRSLHQRFGGYVSVRGFTTADYMFFMTLVSSGTVRCTSADTTIAVIDVMSGVSGGLQTLSQKFAIDYLLGRTTRLKLLAVLAAHPAYHRAKTLLGLRRS
ncbi:glycosyltransferase family 2 protein [Piscinibacter sp. XHJ-5]|uniref:glycosyltransferase family 2 protein n=1 Tax=Piscinibacter sp. XHJ-5 TaxID=3037797 RepID=UPI002452B92D|nr:glycosyltransferase family 2 protein [Piscinibacter sp. XHJ-5]